MLAFCVIGLGKLGGQELNAGSDIGFDITLSNTGPADATTEGSGTDRERAGR